MMKRYDLMVFEENDGTVHANMVEDVDGMYVTYYDALKGIQYAVAAERRRVWDALADEYHRRKWDGQSIALPAWAISFLFPNGEPKLEEQ